MLSAVTVKASVAYVRKYEFFCVCQLTVLLHFIVMCVCLSLSCLPRYFANEGVY